MELLFLSYYCDYIVVEIVVFYIFHIFSMKLFIFGGHVWAAGNKPGNFRWPVR
jgi:hypothetical protein